MSRSLAKAYLGGGCFWCLEAAYKMVKGVTSVTSGYMGGEVPNPSYEQVCTGSTGHAEIVEITYDPAQITYKQLLEVFFVIHDPTQLNRQGNDIGTQYRSIVFVRDGAEQAQVEDLIAELTEDAVFDAPIITEITDLQEFYPADGYHQDYYEKHPEQAYCRAVIAPKLAKLREQINSLLK